MIVSLSSWPAAHLAALDETTLVLGRHHEEDLRLHVVVAHTVQSGYLRLRKLGEEPRDGQPQLQLGQVDPEAYCEQVSQSVH